MDSPGPWASSVSEKLVPRLNNQLSPSLPLNGDNDVNHKFIKPKVEYWSCLFSMTNMLKPQNIQFSIPEDKEKQKMVTI